MLTKLRIQNFKAWKDTGEIRLAPIAVFFGANSAGKTSLLQFLLMLKQTAESPDRRRVLQLGDDYSLVDLGTFQDLIFEHDLKRKLEFELAWTLPVPLELIDPRVRVDYKSLAISFSAAIKTLEEAQYVEWFRYELLRRDQQPPISVRLSRSDDHKYDVVTTGYDLIPIPGRPRALTSPERFYGFPNEVSTRFQNAAFIDDLPFELEEQMKRLLYLGPLRDIPKRHYSWSGDSPEHVGMDGNNTVAALRAGEKRRISAGRHKRAKPFPEVIARWLKQLGLLEFFRAEKIAPNRKEYEVRVRTKGSRGAVDLPDVGFGISQALPVVVECFYAAPHSTVMMEQPELHLHPRVESELADLFIEAIHSREDGEDRSVQFIIESHSEHFLQRLQRRIAEGALKPEEVALYFCEPSEHGSTLRELRVDEFGDIANWPNDFFGDPMTDLAARMKAAALRDGGSPQQ